MKKLTADELRNLKYGQEVVRFENGMARGLRFVAKMPSCEHYLIFEDGEYLTHLYLSSKNETFLGDWYEGPWDSAFVGDLLIKWHEEKIEKTRNIYFKK